MSEVTEQDRIVKVGDVELYVKEPTLKDRREAQKVYNKVFREQLEDGAYLRSQLNEILSERGLWDSKRASRLSQLDKDIQTHEDVLKKGGIKLSQAKETAIKLRQLRFERRILLADRANYDSNTCEGQADNESFNCLLASCVVYNNDRNKRYFKTYEDYLERADEDIAIEAASRFARLYYGTMGMERELPENKFLSKFKFVDEKLRLVNKDGHLCDIEGRLIDEDGRFIAYDDNGEFYYVDIDGNKLEDEIEPVFLDDDGNEISETDVDSQPETEAEAETEEKKTRSSKRKSTKGV